MFLCWFWVRMGMFKEQSWDRKRARLSAEGTMMRSVPIYMDFQEESDRHHQFLSHFTLLWKLTFRYLLFPSRFFPEDSWYSFSRLPAVVAWQPNLWWQDQSAPSGWEGRLTSGKTCTVACNILWRNKEKKHTYAWFVSIQKLSIACTFLPLNQLYKYLYAMQKFRYFIQATLNNLQRLKVKDPLCRGILIVLKTY